MSGVSDVVGIGLAGGEGVRARPLTLKAPGYLRSKAAMAFLGRRLINWVVSILSAEGIKEYGIIAHGKENRYQTKVLLRYGEELGVDVRYSPVKFDQLNRGSADSTLRMLDYWDIRRPSLVFPTDSIIDFDLEPMLHQHLETEAVVTIAAMTRAPAEVAEKYGVMLTNPDRRVLEFVEKPTLADLRAYFEVRDQDEFDRLPLLTNAGFYLVDADALREIQREHAIESLRRARLDFGKDLLPWLVGNGQPVYAHPVRRIGDLGNVRDYVETGVDVLQGRFQSAVRLMGPPYDPERHLWIEPESLHLRDDAAGTTLLEKLSDGSVTIGPGVRIGRYCEIGPGVTIVESNIDDDVEVRTGATIERSMVRDGAIVGDSATVRNSVIGSMSEVRSLPDRPTVLEDFVALGDEVIVHPGAKLAGEVNVYPRLKVPAGVRVPPGKTLTNPQDILDCL